LRITKITWTWQKCKLLCGFGYATISIPINLCDNKSEFAFFGAVASVAALFVFLEQLTNGEGIMSSHNPNAKQNDDLNGEDFSSGNSKESRELFKRALSEALDSKIQDSEEKIKDMEMPAPSRRHKIRMNRLFRERVGGEFLPFPEEDNLYERVRSKLITKLKINELLDRRK